jgi:hypothetical protein
VTLRDRRNEQGGSAPDCRLAEAEVEVEVKVEVERRSGTASQIKHKLKRADS